MFDGMPVYTPREARAYFCISVPTHWSLTAIACDKFGQEEVAQGEYPVNTSPLSVLRAVPSSVNEKVSTRASSSIVRKISPGSVFHSMMVAYSDDVANIFPSGEKATAKRLPFELLNFRHNTSDPVSHSLTIPPDTDTSNLLSGEMAKPNTLPERSPLKLCCSAPEPASHSMAVPSSDPDASNLPYSKKVTTLARSKWPSCPCGGVLGPTSHSLTVPSRDADASTCRLVRRSRR